MRLLLPVAALLAATAQVVAAKEDVLISKRMLQKRSFSAETQYQVRDKPEGPKGPKGPPSGKPGRPNKPGKPGKPPKPGHPHHPGNPQYPTEPEDPEYPEDPEEPSPNNSISFYHINDVHAHLDEFQASGSDCPGGNVSCFGGYARVKTVVDEMRPENPNSLFLNVGDEFQGTLFYTFYKGEKIAETLNQLGFDAMTLGNHEFDGGDDELGAFLANLTFPVLSANIQSTHPILNKTIQPYKIFDEFKLAVIGVTTETTTGISNPGNGTTFSDAIPAVQATIDHIRATTDIKRIAAITHIGYDQDMLLAQQSSGLSLIMGGHSHTPLGNFSDAEGPYPTIVENGLMEEVFVVTAYRWGEYLGYIDITYDDEGKVLTYKGAPIHLTDDIEQDADLQAQVEAWREPFEEFGAEVLGVSDVVLVGDRSCRTAECLLGDVMSDAMVDYRRAASADVDFAIINAGGVRATIDQGDITRGEVLTSFPFGNSVVEIPYTGEQVWDLFEGIVSGRNINSGTTITGFFQVSSDIRIIYDPAAANGTRLQSIEIGGEPLDNATTYTIVTLDFLVGGGDNFFSPAITEAVTLDLQDEVLVQYIQKESPVNVELDGRITRV